VAWWVWAIALAAGASATTNPILLVLVLGVLGLVVASRRGDAPWARAFRYYLGLALVVVAVRVVFRVAFGTESDASSAHALVTLPHLSLPGWLSGARLGGPVTAAGALGALYDGLRLATLLCCVGAANALANPKRALRVLPGALYELGVAVVVALSVAPQLVESVQRVRRAQRLRAGAGGRRVRLLRRIAIPVLEDALERSLRLAAAMDSRGYGRSAGAGPQRRRLTGLLVLGGMCGLCLGAYGLLAGSAAPGIALPALVAGAGLCAAGLVAGGRRVQRTHYRPDPWRASEWATVLAGLLPAAVLVGRIGATAAALHPATEPLVWPALPVLPLACVLAGALPAVLAPPPLRPAARSAGRPPAELCASAPAPRLEVPA
jgi:energy-coupling factor transport system permease protein